MNSGKPVTLTPLGGLGEIGMNCMLLHTEQEMIVIDCGLMFPDDYLLGIDIVIPRFDYLLANKHKLKGVILTHGHEDHIGALAWLVPYIKAPLFGSKFTLSLVENRLREHGLDKHTTFREVKAGDRLAFDDLAVSFFRVCHSIIEGFGLGIETPVGRFVHTGDFKIDNSPMGGNFTDLSSFSEFASQGTTLLLSDSTNVERTGHSITEREIMSTLDELFAKAEGRLLVTLFSSHIQRIQEIFDLAKEHGRKVAVNGRSLLNNIEMASNLGYLRIPAKTWVDLDEVRNLPDERVALIVTGSQGEPLSALARISNNEHRQLRIHPGDTVLMSSRFIPGNVRAITKVINNLYRLGAEVLYERVQAIHASGHAYREELQLMLQTIKPKYFIPVHGEYRHLVKHKRLAEENGVAPERALAIENGQPVTFLPDGGIRLGDTIPVDSIYVDGKGVGDVGHTVLKERHLLGGGGLVVAVMVIDEENWEIILGPDVQSKGFVFEQQYSHLLEDAKCIILDIFENIPPGEEEKLRERIRSSLRRFFRKVLERDPVVLPLVMVV